MTSATEELRRLLDERGVEHEGGERSVRWRDHNGVMMQAFPLADGELGMEVWSCTPAQAIAATLGCGTCRLESMHGYTDPYVATRYVVELSCHTLDDWPESEPPAYCPWCGAKIVGPTTNDVDGEVVA